MIYGMVNMIPKNPFENCYSVFLKKGLKPFYILLFLTAPMIMICNCYSGFIIQNYTYLDTNNWLFFNVVLWERLIFRTYKHKPDPFLDSRCAHLRRAFGWTAERERWASQGKSPVIVLLFSTFWGNEFWIYPVRRHLKESAWPVFMLV